MKCVTWFIIASKTNDLDWWFLTSHKWFNCILNFIGNFDMFHMIKENLEVIWVVLSYSCCKTS